MNVMERYKEWLTSPVFDETTKNELTGLSTDEIHDRFYCDLEFGTSGMRGILGAGTNRMNIYLVRRLSYSLGQLVRDAEASARGVVIAYDSRRFSQRFAKETALVLAAMGIKAYLFDDIRPTPQLSFAVRKLNAFAGVMITASHNPKEYNGYKVYGVDGGQITPEKADIITNILKQTSWEISVADEATALSRGLLEYAGHDIDDEYLEAIASEMLRPELTRAEGKKLRVVYTPLHGCGRNFVREALADYELSIVAEQEAADTEFSTVPSPNPEDPGAWALALKLASEKDAELLLATDPDSDRLGVQCLCKDGSYKHLTGNQVGVILLNYILESYCPTDGVVIHNFVSTALARKIVDYYNVELRTVPVGFRFVGEQIRNMEDSSGEFLFAFEESIGYLKGTYTRDKDAVLAAALCAEAALYYKVTSGKTLDDVLTDLFDKFGYFLDEQLSLTFPGSEGKQRIDAIMKKLPATCTTEMAGMKISGCGMEGKLFVMTFANGGFVKARASGTEPKIRFYFCIGGSTLAEAESRLKAIKSIIKSHAI